MLFVGVLACWRVGLIFVVWCLLSFLFGRVLSVVCRVLFVVWLRVVC